MEVQDGELYLRPRFEPEGGWKGEAAYRADRDTYLVPHTTALLCLLRAVEEGHTRLTWWLRMECGGEDSGRQAYEIDVPHQPGDVHQEAIDLVARWRELGEPAVKGAGGELISDLERWLRWNGPEHWESIRRSLQREQLALGVAE